MYVPAARQALGFKICAMSREHACASLSKCGFNFRREAAASLPDCWKAPTAGRGCHGQRRCCRSLNVTASSDKECRLANEVHVWIAMVEEERQCSLFRENRKTVETYSLAYYPKIATDMHLWYSGSLWHCKSYLPSCGRYPPPIAYQPSPQRAGPPCLSALALEQ